MYIKGKLDPSGGAEDMNTNTTVFPIPCPECPIMEWESGIEDDVAERVFDAESMSVWVSNFQTILRSNLLTPFG